MKHKTMDDYTQKVRNQFKSLLSKLLGEQNHQIFFFFPSSEKVNKALQKGENMKYY